MLFVPRQKHYRIAQDNIEQNIAIPHLCCLPQKNYTKTTTSQNVVYTTGKWKVNPQSPKPRITDAGKSSRPGPIPAVLLTPQTKNITAIIGTRAVLHVYRPANSGDTILVPQCPVEYVYQ